MKLFVFLVFLLLSLPVLAAPGEGGSHSNGGGGLRVSTKGWHALSGFPFEVEGPGYLELLASFHEQRPEVKLGVCPKTPALAIPEFPAKFEDGLFTFFLGSGNTALTLERVCRNSKSVEAYGQLVIALYQLADDPAALHLIRKIQSVKPKAPIRVSILPRSKRVGGIRETTWYNAASDRLFWSRPPRAENFLEILAGRSAHRLLKHELVHVFQKRVLGDRYPKSSKSHDRVTNASEYLFGSEWTKNKTSPEAAFIEGFANAMEIDGYSIEHPFMEPMRENFMAMREDGCYFAHLSMFKGTSDKKILQKLDNEIYASSAFATIVEAYADENLLHDKPAGGKVVMWYNVDRSIAMIDAFAALRSLSYRQFALEFDRASRSDIGSRWLREYYFTEASTGKNLGDLFEIRTDENAVFMKKKLCLKNQATHSLYLSPLLERERKEVEKEARRAYIENLPLEEIRDSARSKGSSYPSQIVEMQKNLVSLDRAQTLFEDLAKKAKLCGLQDPSEPLAVDEIQPRLMARFGQLIATLELGVMAQKEGCKNGELKRAASIAQQSGAEFERIIRRTEVTALPFEAKKKLVEDWERLSAQSGNATVTVRKILGLARLYQDEPKIFFPKVGR